MAPTIIISGNEAWIEGPEADKLNAFYANGTKLNISSDGKIDFSGIEGNKIRLKATLSTGVIMTQTINRE